MAQRPKAKPKIKDQRNTDKEQSARFIETARIIGADESGDQFERAVSRVLKKSSKKLIKTNEKSGD